MNKWVLEEDYHLTTYKLSRYLYKRIEKEITITIDKPNFILTKYWIIVKKGFRWDGCTPKWKLGSWWLGTHDGRYEEEGFQKMYFPSLVHDVLYANLEQIPLSRKTVDLLFYELAVMHGFKFAWLYYIAVRLFGGVYHNLKKYFNERGRR